MTLDVSISHNFPVDHSTICRYCHSPITQGNTDNASSPGGKDPSDWYGPDGSWCNSAGNRLSREEWLQQPQHKLTIAELLKDKGNFSPRQYHEPVSNRTESELVA